MSFETVLAQVCSDFEKRVVDEQFPLLTDDGDLTQAAIAGHAAKLAKKEKMYDAAWRLLNNQKSMFHVHASASGFDARSTLALDGTVHEEMADVLRLEGRHREALVHIVYWIVSANDRPIKRHDKKLFAYFNRCKFENVTLDIARTGTRRPKDQPDFLSARNLVSEWVACG